MTLDGHHHVNRFNGLIAVRYLEGHSSEVRVLVRKLLLLQAHVRRADIRPRHFRCAVEIEVCFRVQRVADLHVVVGDAVLFTVINVRAEVTLDGHHHVNRFNGLVTVRYLKGHSSEVHVLVRELLLLQAHVRGTDIRPRRFRCAAEGEVLLGIQRVADLYIIAGDAVLFTVINMLTEVALDGHHHINRFNGLIAVRHLKLHIPEVRVDVRELALRQAHLCRTDIRPRSSCCTAEGEVCLLIQRIADLYLVAGHAVLLAIVGICTVMACDGHNHVNRFNGQVAISHLKHYRRKVRVVVRELIGSKTHVRCADVCPRGCCRSTEGEVRLLVQRIADLHIIAGHAMLLVVIGFRAVMTCNGHNHMNRFNGLMAVCYLERHFPEVLVLILELIDSQTHGRRAGVGPFGFCSSAEREVI